MICRPLATAALRLRSTRSRAPSRRTTCTRRRECHTRRADRARLRWPLSRAQLPEQCLGSRGRRREALRTRGALPPRPAQHTTPRRRAVQSLPQSNGQRSQSLESAPDATDPTAQARMSCRLKRRRAVTSARCLHLHICQGDVKVLGLLGKGQRSGDGKLVSPCGPALVFRRVFLDLQFGGALLALRARSHAAQRRLLLHRGRRGVAARGRRPRCPQLLMP